MTSTNPMLSLPTEMVDKIIDYLPRKRDVVHLRKVHRNFQPSAQQALLKDVHLHMQCGSQAYNFQQLNSFYDALCFDSSISGIVRKITLENECGSHGWNVDATGKRLDQEGRDLFQKWISDMRLQFWVVQDLLAKLPELKKITLRFTGDRVDYPSFEFLFMSLRRIVKDCRVSVGLEYHHSCRAIREHLLTLPNLETVSVERDFDTVRALGAVYDRNFKNLVNHRVRSLDLGFAEIGGFESVTDFGNRMAATFPRLVHLRGRLARYVDVTHFIPSLHQLKDTLQTIDLYNAPWSVRNSQYHTLPIDFKIFSKLRTLRIPSSAWLHQLSCKNFDEYSRTIRYPPGLIWRLPDEGRKNIHTHLPPSLEDLTITFVWPNAIFARGWAYQSQFKLLPQMVQMKGFDWILELLKTNVKKVKLVEEAGGIHGECDHWGREPGKEQQARTSQVKSPEAARQAFDAAGVALEIFLLDETDQIPILAGSTHH